MIPLLAASTVLIFLSILFLRKFTFGSYEGIGVFLIFVTLISANLLSISGIVTLDKYDLAFSTMIHCLGIASLWLGISFYRYCFENHSPSPILQVSHPKTRTFIKYSLVIGVSLPLVGMLFSGLSIIDIVLLQSGAYITEKSFLGGWIDKSLGLMIVAAAIIMITTKSKKNYFFITLFLISASLILSLSRGGLLTVVLVFFAAISIYRSQSKLNLRSALVFNMTVILIISIFVGGAATLQRAASANPLANTDNNLVSSFFSRVVDRFGEEGLAVGYSNILSRAGSHEIPYFKGRIANYSITSNLPPFLYANKPMHPFRGTGTYVYSNRPPANLFDVSAFGLVASAYMDYGVYSLTCYLFLIGIFLGMIKHFFLRVDNTGILYINFIFMDGASNFIHGGITTILGGFILTIIFFILILLTSLPEFLIKSRKA